MTPDRAWLAFVAILVAVCWLWWTHRTFPAEYGPDWPPRRATYWQKYGRFCRACYGNGDCLHHPIGVGHRWPAGHEPDRGPRYPLIGLCQRCHDLIHRLDHWFDRKLGFNRPIVLRLSTMLILLLFVPVRVVRRRPR